MTTFWLWFVVASAAYYAALFAGRAIVRRGARG